jgi:hypothetical protein
MKYIAEVNKESTKITRMNAMESQDVDACMQKKGEVFERIKGPLWMLVNYTIFEASGQAEQTKLIIDNLNELLIQDSKLHCQKPNADISIIRIVDATCEKEELKRTEVYLNQIDKVISTLFKTMTDEDKKDATLGFLDLKVLFENSKAKLFEEELICRHEVHQLKKVYMPQLKLCLDQMMNQNLDLSRMTRVQRISCAKELRNKIDDMKLKLLHFEVTRSLNTIG